MKKQVRSFFIFVIAVLAASLVFSGCTGKQQDEEKQPATFAELAQNTVSELFGDWTEAADYLRTAFTEPDGTDKPVSLHFEMYPSAKEMGTKAGLSLSLDLETDAEGRSRADFLFGSSLGETLNVEMLSKENTGAFRVKTAAGTYKAKTTDTFRISWDSIEQQLSASVWNPAVNPDSPLDAETFARVRELVKDFRKETKDGEKTDSSALAALGEEFRKVAEITENTAESGERQFVLTVTPDGFASLTDALENLAAQHPLLRMLLNEDSGTETAAGLLPGLTDAYAAFLPELSLSDSLPTFLRTGKPRLKITFTAAGDRFSEIYAELSAADNEKNPVKLTADMTFRYGKTENGCTLCLSSETEGAAAAVLPMTVTYTVQKEGAAHAFSMELAADSSAISVTGSVEKPEHGVTLKVDSIRMPEQTVYFTPGQGIRTEKGEKTVHPKLELTVKERTEALSDPFATDFDLGTATAAQVQTLAQRDYFSIPLSVLASVLQPDYGDALLTQEGYLCQPDDALRAQGEAYSKLFAAYLQNDPVGYPYAVLKDTTLGCWYLLLYENSEKQIQYVVSVEEPPADLLSVFHPASVKDGALEMHSWAQSNIPATCQNPPVLRTYCTVCGAYYDREVGSPLPHKMIEASDAYADINGKTVGYILHYCADCRSNLSIDAPDFTLRLEELENTNTFYVAASGKKSLSVPEIHIPYWIEPKSDRVMDTVLLNCSGVEATVLSFAEGVRVIAPETRIFKSVKTLILPKSLESMDVQAFLELTNLEKVLYAGTEEEWRKVEGWPRYVKSSMPNVKVEFNYSGK